ncbi:hypothetical protein JDS91_33890, partial [Bacillus cereus]|nr:hypothetical protein [Bacillus cereus]
EQKEYAEMYGGDLFLKGTNLKVKWKDQELSETKATHLGALKSDIIEQKLTVLNDTSGNVAENIEIQIAVYKKEFGWEWCDLATDNNGTPNQYEDT